MSAHGGPNIVEDGLVLALDAANAKSSLRKKQSSNILVDPNTWSPGTGGSSGYGANGSASEQNRLYVNDDPWGRRSVTWRTTPDATSGADGGWNSSYYSIDRSFTYRWSIWVRRYTSGTGGTFYMGLNPAPIRNDNGASQGNPYFTCPSIASLTQNQWYLVVGHIFYEGYSGGRHPDSGWYQNGVKISDKSFCNMGSQDGRWASGTTSAMHRAYHYYTTNTASGIEFAFPRVDKCDGNEPSIKDLINTGESGWKGLGRDKREVDLYNGVSFDTSDVGSYDLDGTNDSINFSYDLRRDWSFECWVKHDVVSGFSFLGQGPTSANQGLHIWFTGNSTIRFGMYSNDRDFTLSTSTNTWYHYVFTYSHSSPYTKKMYRNGVEVTNGYNVGGPNQYAGTGTVRIGATYSSGGAYANGKFAKTKLYNKVLTSSEVLQNYNATKGRFGL
jgi:hypothetical protein